MDKKYNTEKLATKNGVKKDSTKNNGEKHSTTTTTNKDGKKDLTTKDGKEDAAKSASDAAERCHSVNSSLLTLVVVFCLYTALLP